MGEGAAGPGMGAPGRGVAGGRGPVGGAHPPEKPRPHGGGGRAAPGWVGPCPSPPPPAAAPGAAGLRADSSPGDPARAAAGCVRRGSAAVPLLRAPPASGAPGEADPLPPPHPTPAIGLGRERGLLLPRFGLGGGSQSGEVGLLDTVPP